MYFHFFILNYIEVHWVQSCIEAPAKGLLGRPCGWAAAGNLKSSFEKILDFFQNLFKIHQAFISLNEKLNS